jgi:phosphonate transport system substrate-binding protein
MRSKFQLAGPKLQNWAWAILYISSLSFSAITSANEVLNFGLYTSDKPSAMIRQFRPVLDELENDVSAKLGKDVKIRIQVASSYELGMENLVQGRVDFARFGPASYVSAKKMNPGLRVIAMEHKRGSKQFNGVICIPADSEVISVEQLAGTRFAFGNERSTIGRYLAQKYLVDHGITAGDLAGYDYLDRHDLVGTAVATGRYDAGALKESTLKKLIKNGANLKALAKFPNVTKPWVASAGLDSAIYRAIKEALLEFDDEKALKALKKDGFLEGADSDYDIIRQGIEKNSLFFE